MKTLERQAKADRLRSAIIVVLLVLFDRVTKLAIQRSFSDFDMYTVIPGILNIVHAPEESGSGFQHAGDRIADDSQKLVLIGLSTLVLAIVGVLPCGVLRVRFPLPAKY